MKGKQERKGTRNKCREQRSQCQCTTETEMGRDSGDPGELWEAAHLEEEGHWEYVLGYCVSFKPLVCLPPIYHKL